MEASWDAEACRGVACQEACLHLVALHPYRLEASEEAHLGPQVACQGAYGNQQGPCLDRQGACPGGVPALGVVASAYPGSVREGLSLGASVEGALVGVVVLPEQEMVV